MTIKVIVTDMDGTFLDDAKKIRSCTFYGAVSGTKKTGY